MEKTKTIICAAFPGTGKTSYCRRNVPEKFANRIDIDLDSSKFDKSDFPRNYIESIKEKIEKGYSTIFVSSHKDVRDALIKEKLEFILAYPDISLKEEYLIRYKERGSSSLFIQTLDENWNRWIEDCQNQIDCKHIVLPSMIFLADVL